MRTYTHTRTTTKFTAGETAPTAMEAETGTIMPNQYGNIALQGFEADRLDATSEVRLDTSIEPPVLHLNNALTTTLFGYVDQQTGEFVNHTHELPSAGHIVSGQYTGPGSVLDLI